MKPVFSGTLLACEAVCVVLSLAEMQGCTWVLLDPLAVLSLPATWLSSCPAV